MGVKGSAAGGGLSQCIPLTQYSLGFTGDINAVMNAHNLAMVALTSRMQHERNYNDEKLLKLSVFDGERERTILSGIAKWYEPEELIGRNVAIVANLAPRPMMKGKYVSEGMIFAADTADGGCSIAFYGDDTPVGSRIH